MGGRAARGAGAMVPIGPTRGAARGRGKRQTVGALDPPAHLTCFNKLHVLVYKRPPRFAS